MQFGRRVLWAALGSRGSQGVVQPHWSCVPTQIPEPTKVTTPVLKKTINQTNKKIPQTPQRHKTRKKTPPIQLKENSIPSCRHCNHLHQCIKKRRNLSLRVFSVGDIESKIRQKIKPKVMREG